MTYRDALWTAIIGEAKKAAHKIARAKRDRYLKLCNYWRKVK